MPSVTREFCSRTVGGEVIDVFTLTNGRATEVRAMTYGGIILSIRVVDREGHSDDVTLGYDEPSRYLADNSPYFGTITGRVANRIAQARFALDGRTYRLAANDGVNHIHGGPGGFDKVVWKAEPFDAAHGAGVVLSHVSPDGHEGYPGTLAMRVTYTLTATNELIVDYHATTDRPTPVNPTQHVYFNLTGAARDVRAHVLQIPAERYLPVDEDLIPTGGTAAVENTPFDFRRPIAIGARVVEDHPQLRRGGYDHTFVLTSPGREPVAAARVEDPGTGRLLEVWTTEPAVHLYTANAFDSRLRGKGGRLYSRFDGFCLETQHYPDSPNQPQFPSIILRPGDEFNSRTIFRFGSAGLREP